MLKIKEDKSEDCVAFILLTVVRKMGAVLRSDNFVEGAKIVLRATRSSGLLCCRFRTAFDVRPAVATSSGFQHAASTLFVQRVGARWSFSESILDTRHVMRIC
jgi:hypothetical protein